MLLMGDCEMKIVHLCLSNFFIDNYSYQENLLTKYHVKMGYDVTVVASLVSFNSEGHICLLNSACEYINSDGVKVIRLPYKNDILYRLNRQLRRYKGVFKILLDEKPDIIFVHGTSFGDACWVVKYKKIYPKIKIFADSHADWVNSARNWLSLNIKHKLLWRYTTSQLVNVSEKIFGVLPIRCEFLRQVYRVPEKKIEYLPMGVDDDAIPQNKEEVKKTIRRELGLNKEDFVIVTGGKIDALKNTLLLMEAINEIEDSKVHLIIFGTILPELEERFHKLLSDRIHYVGWCNAQQIINYFISADMACFPGTHSTLWEEAVGLGIPCIFKSWKGMHYVNQNGNSIFLYEDSIQEIKKVLMDFLDGDKYNEILGKAKIAASQFRYSVIAKKAIGFV